MAHKKGQSTGPKTVGGKLKSSKNAQKYAIFSKGYLPSEDIELKQSQFDELVHQWGAHDPTRHLLVRDIEQAQLQLERLMDCERRIIEGVMQSSAIAQEFCVEAGISLLMSADLPAWYFKSDAAREKTYAEFVARVYEEAHQLQANFHDHIISKIPTLYPDLYAYIMSGQAQGASFVSILGQKYKQSVPTLNLGALINQFAKDLKFHLIWASSPERYQTIIDGIRGRKILQLIDWDKHQRYATSIQNRKIKGFHALVTMDRLDQEAQRLGSDLKSGIGVGETQSGNEITKPDGLTLESGD